MKFSMQAASLMFASETICCVHQQESIHPHSIKELIMSNTNTAASTAHKQAASEHKACAEHHTKAADCYDKGKLDEAKASSKSAMSCCDAASKKSATACA
jgi:hypothetical protein